jgi:thiamine pyrophosphokinase
MKNKSALIILNGKEFNKKEFLNSFSDNSLIIAVDGGIRHLEEFDVPPVIHIGDMDSSVPGSKVPVKDTEIFPSDKNFSDFHLALEYAQKKKVSEVLVFAATGGRSDHFLSNYETAVSFTEKGLKITFIGRSENIFFICCSEKFNFPKNSTVSVFSGTALTESVTLKGFKYSLINAVLYRNTPLGLSNVTVSDSQSVSLKNGVLTIVFNKKKC